MATMSIFEFGERLIATRDLDPVYVGLAGAELPLDQLRRWLIAYWMFYHAGVASWLSEQEGAEYWTWVMHAAVNDEAVRPAPVGGRWPRAAERRHFRGQACMRAVDWFSKSPPGEHVKWLEGMTTQRAVMAEVEKWPLHGPWISFKAADMMERVVGVPLAFDPDVGLVYKEPRAALDILAAEPGPEGRTRTAEDWWNYLQGYFGPLMAPPNDDRACGVQEVETVLCKWKSHTRGHYPVGKDILEVRHALKGWGGTAERMLRAMPEEVQ